MTEDDMDKVEVLCFNKILSKWYIQNARDLLWRSTRDPYKIWLSEVILQQTRVVQGTPYYVKFTSNYPTVYDLAAAPLQEVLRLWQGLGYYSRARNLHASARMVVEEYGGEFPRTARELVKLKGLGAYTAAAIASFAFDEPVPAIDGNVYRVMARIFGIETDILSPAAKKEFFSLGQTLISQDDPATYNQAMIEFGALQCVPVAPNCEVCVFKARCFAYAHQAQDRLPVKAKKIKARSRYLNYFILYNGQRIALKERVGKGIWNGLYDFYEIETQEPHGQLEDFAESYGLNHLLRGGVVEPVDKAFVHLLTHQKLHVRFWKVDFGQQALPALPEAYGVFDLDRVGSLPKPILIDQVLRQEGFLEQDEE
ncbi:A/G-specific adenine glycosylase [Dyadobacter tibetensis]|uniref:A/G-specific adenine glycosylase n=1 Tax=Dyadobacter tibetensis TaxID=1211851 RepID=UPI0004BCF2E7|nr:A/G-specific adenine glycosylase [Dyadobacter tibetensis]